MKFMTSRAAFPAAIPLLLSLAGCAGDRPPEHFTRPDYSYLQPLYLNVADVRVQDTARPRPKTLAAEAPWHIDQLAGQMAQQRLQGRGGAGLALATIQQADILYAHHEYEGVLRMRLNLSNPQTGERGQITARVSRETEPEKGESRAASLNRLANGLLNDMNVELEYQLRKNLPGWLTSASGEPLADAQVQVQDLEENPDAVNQTPSSGTPAVSPANPAPAGRNAAPPSAAPGVPQQPNRSPAPGFLRLPS